MQRSTWRLPSYAVKDTLCHWNAHAHSISVWDALADSNAF